MLLSLNWLKDYVKFNQTPEKIADILTRGGFEAEEIIRHGEGFENVIIGQIKTIVSHAEADKLSVCKVDIGKKQLLNIVCGAKNIKPGQRVPVAVVGAKLPNGLEIEKRKIRGVDSEGMLCAEDELGLGNDHSGIMILDDNLRIGANFGRATGLKDTVLNLSLTPNRPDSYSVIGLAREFAALSGQKFAAPKLKLGENPKYSAKKILSVVVRDKKLCPKYAARIIKGVKVRPSPQWLRARLILSGIKPVNNIVDITNYVMLETGQPLHAFDLNNIAGRKIIVRPAGADRKFITLDGVERELSSEMLMIADAKKSIAIAGVMGGQNSEISKTTRDIVIESAIFNPYSIRKTRQKLGLMTEASSRFEKGIYFESPEPAANRAAMLIVNLAGGETAKEMIVIGDKKKNPPVLVEVSLNYINKIIGRNFTLREVTDILNKLYFSVSAKDEDKIKVAVPFFRTDISAPADIVEEVGRVYGWHNLSPANIYAELKPTCLPKEKMWQRRIQDILAGAGLTEVYNYSFYSAAMARQSAIDPKNHYLVSNPISLDQKYMRTSLLPGLIGNVLKYHKEREQIKLFEFGHVYLKGAKRPVEDNHLAAIFYQKSNKVKEPDITTSLHQAMNLIFRKLDIAGSRVRYQAGKDGSYNIIVDGQPIGVYGFFSRAGNKIGLPPLYFEFDFAALAGLARDKAVYKKTAGYPAVEHDFTFVADAKTDYQAVVAAVKSLDKRVVIFRAAKDLYRQSDQTRGATFQAVFQAADHTLAPEEVSDLRKKIISELDSRFEMKLKG